MLISLKLHIKYLILPLCSMLVLQLLLAHRVDLALVLLLERAHVMVMFALHVSERVLVDLLQVPLLLEGVVLQSVGNLQTTTSVVTEFLFVLLRRPAIQL